MLQPSGRALPLAKGLQVLLVLAAAFFVVGALALFAFRLNYPFELEWQEGGMLDHVIQLDEGKPLYPAPSAEFIPFIYPPLYCGAAWVFAQLFSIGFFTGRLVSVLATLGAAWIIVASVNRRTESLFWAFVAGGFFFALYPVTAFWFDLVRVDSLALFLIVAGYALSGRNSAWAPAATAALLLLAFATKQTAAVFILFAALYYLVRSRRELLLFAASIIVLGGLAAILAGAEGREMVFYYVFSVPARHGSDASLVKNFFANDLAAKIPFLLALLVLVPAPTWSDLGLARRGGRAAPLPFFLAAAAVSSFLARIHPGSAANARIHLYVFVVLALFSLMTPERLERLRGFSAALFLILLLQFAVFAYNPAAMIPAAADRAAGERFLDLVRGMPGKVLIPDHGFYATIAGKERAYHSMAFFDIFRQNQPDSLAKAALADIQEKLQSHYWSAVILDADRERPFLPLLERFYARSQPVFAEGESFFTSSGLRTRPEWIWRPRR